MATWLVQKVSYDGNEVWASVTVVGGNLMEAESSASRVFDYRSQRSGIMVAEHLVEGKNDMDGYIIPAAKQRAEEYRRLQKEGYL